MPTGHRLTQNTSTMLISPLNQKVGFLSFNSFKEAMRNRSLEDIFKGYPINAKEEILSHQYSFD